MTPENLLNPRYKVIADYPGCPFKVGQILEKVKVASGKEFVRGMFHQPEDFPANFKKLEWWEERKPEEMPEYVKSIMQEYTYGVKVGVIIKVKEWARLCDAMYAIQSRKEEYHASCFIPATADDYNTYLQ